ncbi:MAG: serine/threonine-protein kinase, partial [Planctomycetota bacterium]
MSEANEQIAGYTIVREIGRGGMGVVHLAHDPKLDRPVAIKALPADFANEPERLARFEREARVLASLSHGNIATVYGLELVDGGRYLVMEFVEGEPLSERLADGPLPVSEALMICSQVAAGVEAAHEAGVVHRDLKPGNIIVRPDGTAKVLDFGLAREMPERNSRSAVAAAATAPPSAVTGEGVTIGTPGYMSPEQVRGMTVDRRTDNFAFGCILYECLTGRLAFPGQTATDSIAAILEREPDWSLLPDGTPPTVQLLLRRCLQKDRRRRLRDIGDARIDIEQAIDDPSSTVLGLAELTLRGTHRTRPSAAHVAVGALIALVAAAAAWLLKPTPPTPDAPVVRTSVAIGTSWRSTHFALAPDGSRLVFVFTPI